MIDAKVPNEGCEQYAKAIAADAARSTWKVHLWTDLLPLHSEAGIILSDFVEASFPGYAPADCIPWDSTTFGGVGESFLPGPTVEFEQTDDAPPQVILGYFMSRNDGGTRKLLNWVQIPEPFTFRRRGDHLAVAATVAAFYVLR